jgi:tripartite ATP-independent transporter DctM subunit
MIAATMIAAFVAMMAFGVPIAVALGLAASGAIAMAGLGMLAVPTNVYAGIAKYPLLAIPMFVLVGVIFDRSGVSERLVRFATAVLGHGRGTLGVVAVMVAMFLGGISGSGPANAAAVGGVMIASMSAAGYPRPFSASVIGAAAATDILIPPSIAFIVYSVIVPSASVPALFAAGLVPGVMVGLALIVPILWLSRRHGFGGTAAGAARPPFWSSLIAALPGLFAPVLILGGMRAGLFTPTEAAVTAVVYGLFVGIVIHRAIGLRDIYEMLVEAAEISAVILIVVGLAGAFAWALNTLGVVDPLARAIVDSGLGEVGVMALIVVLLVFVGTVLDGVSIFLILLPLLAPIARAFQWDLVWFGVLMTMLVALGQFTPPMAVNLMVACRIAKVGIETTLPWVGWFVLATLVAIALVALFPGLALWLPRELGY